MRRLLCLLGLHSWDRISHIRVSGRPGHREYTGQCRECGKVKIIKFKL